MSSWLQRTLWTGVATLALVSFSASAHADADALIKSKDITGLQSLLASESTPDATLRSLLRATYDNMALDPVYASQLISLAGQNASKLSSAGVAAVCADMRRVSQGMTPDLSSSDLFKAVSTAASSFAKAPVVVSSGRPNLCEEALAQIAMLSNGEEALLAQQPNQPPNIPPTDPKPPESTPTPPPEKPPVDEPSPE